MNDKFELIRKLLAQAEGEGVTQEEAAAFSAQAQKLATAYGVDLARARYATRAKEKTLPIRRSIKIGNPGEKGNTTLVDLFLGIANANDVRCSIAHNSTYVYAHGFEEDLEVAEAMYGSLLVQMSHFLVEFRRSEAWKKDEVYREGHYRHVIYDYDTGETTPCKEPGSHSGWRHECEQEWVDGNYKPITWLTARINFQDGFAGTIRHRLAMAKYEEQDRIRQMEEERARKPHLDDGGHVTEEFAYWLDQAHGINLDDLEDETGTVAELSETLRDLEDEWTQELLDQWKADKKAQEDEKASTAIVLAAKAEAIEDFYYQKNPHLKKKRSRSWRGSRSSASSYSAQNAGRDAGNRASLGRSTNLPGQRKELGS